MSEDEAAFARDMLRGAEEIAQFLFGDARQRRKIYHLAASSNLPVFKLGSMICARKSVLLEWVGEQERRHANDNHRPGGNSVASGKV